MKCSVFKHKRMRAGKRITARHYTGRYQLPGDLKETTVALSTADKSVAEARLRRIVREAEQEREGLIAPRAEREWLKKPLIGLLDEYVSELRQLGRNEKYVTGVDRQISKLAGECGWVTAKDVTAESFQAWRRAQTKLPKTLNEYLTAASALLAWLEQAGRIPANPLRRVARIETYAEASVRRRALSDE